MECWKPRSLTYRATVVKSEPVGINFVRKPFKACDSIDEQFPLSVKTP